MNPAEFFQEAGSRDPFNINGQSSASQETLDDHHANAHIQIDVVTDTDLSKDLSIIILKEKWFTFIVSRNTPFKCYVDCQNVNGEG